MTTTIDRIRDAWRRPRPVVVAVLHGAGAARGVLLACDHTATWWLDQPAPTRRACDTCPRRPSTTTQEPPR